MSSYSSLLGPPRRRTCVSLLHNPIRDARRDAAAFACVCKDAAAAAPASKWHAAVRIGRGGAVLEPASGTGDVTVAPDKGVQAAVRRCPRGGSVLLLPGTHNGPLVLEADREVHLFGRGLATLRTAYHMVVDSKANTATLKGLIIRCEGDSGGGVHIRRGALRLQACDIKNASRDVAVWIQGGGDPVLAFCRRVDERVWGGCDSASPHECRPPPPLSAARSVGGRPVCAPFTFTGGSSRA